jgi:predicted RNA-binding Zn ribbon-like protein
MSKPGIRATVENLQVPVTQRLHGHDESAGNEFEGAPFFFLGGDVSLDLVNTRMFNRGGLVDAIRAPEDLAAWVAASSLAAEFGVPTAIDSNSFAQVVDLRRALKAGFDAIVAGARVPDDSIATMNAVLRHGPGSELRRDPAGGDLQLGLRVDLAADSRPLPWLLADAGAALMVGDRAHLLRRCANHDTCVLMFLDTSRSRTRRWCSMELCGNRNKVAAHAARSRSRRSELETRRPGRG